MTQTTWATAGDVLALTGLTPSALQLTQANMIIEVFSRRVYTDVMPAGGTPRIGARDLEWMKRAVAFQSVWMAGQPDFFTRLDVTTITEGRKSIGLKEQTLMVAPMARMALSRVSWQKTRSVHVKSTWQDGMTPISSDPDSAGNDFYQVWSGMGD